MPDIKADPQGYVEYSLQFDEALAAAAGEALGQHPMQAGLMTSAVYSAKFRTAAAQAGFELGLPLNLSIALLVWKEKLENEKSVEGMGFLQRRNKSNRELRSFHSEMSRFFNKLDLKRNQKILVEFYQRYRRYCGELGNS